MRPATASRFPNSDGSTGSQENSPWSVLNGLGWRRRNVYETDTQRIMSTSTLARCPTQG